MFQLDSRMVINRALADVWRFLSDLPRVPTWECGVLEVRQTSPGTPGVGTTLAVRRVYFGRETLVECHITNWEELRGMTVSLWGGPLRGGWFRYAVEPAGDGQTLVTYTAEGELIPALKFLTPLAPALGRANQRRNLAKLKRLLEVPSRKA